NVFPGAFAATNCLWERVFLTLKDDSDIAWSLFNNLHYGGTLSYRARGTQPILVASDNLFDQATITKGTSSATFSNDYNGYVTNKNRLTPNGAHDVVMTNAPTYLASYLGAYYYPTNDGMLSLLANTGSRGAALAGLFHHTTTTNQVKEAS